MEELKNLIPHFLYTAPTYAGESYPEFYFYSAYILGGFFKYRDKTFFGITLLILNSG